MKNLKKTIAAMLALAMVIPMAGCGKDKETAESSDGVPTLSWLVPGDKQADTALVLEKANAILEEKCGAKLDLQFIDTGAFTEKMNMKMASSEEFDICFTGYVNKFPDGVRKGGFYDMTEFIENSEKIKATIPQYILDLTKIDGRYYGIANQQVIPVASGLFVDKKLADEFGLKVEDIKCLEDIEPFLKWVKENKPDLYPFRTGGTNYGSKNGPKENFADVPNGHGVIVWDNDGNYEIKPKYELEGAFANAEILWDWYQKGYIRQDVASVLSDTQEVNAGRYAAWRGTYKPGGAEEFAITHGGREVICALISTPILSGGGGTAANTAISKSSKHPELAFKIIEEVNTNPELLNILCYGIEGTHYTLDENGCAVPVENSGYPINAAWKMGNVFNSLRTPGQPEDVWEQTAKFNEEALKSPINGFVFDSTPVRVELGQISTVQSKYDMLTNGSADPSMYLDSYIEEMKKAGAEVVVEEVKRQVAEWEKTK